MLDNVTTLFFVIILAVLVVVLQIKTFPAVGQGLL